MSVAAAVPGLQVAVAHEAPNQNNAIRRQIPSLRNREVFAAVVMGKSHAQVAGEFGLTQPRVTQIMRQVRDWCTQATRGEGDYNEIQRLRVAEETLRVQLDGWMRMAMQEWHKSRREGLGKPVFLNAAMRLATNTARLAGVDVSGKTARLRAEQQALAEAELRRLRGEEKALWEREQELRMASESRKNKTAPTPVAATNCEESPAPNNSQPVTSADQKNSYGLADSAPVSDLVRSIKERFTPAIATPAGNVPDKPIPKFLDKKVRKRLLALRRQEARSQSLTAVG